MDRCFAIADRKEGVPPGADRRPPPAMSSPGSGVRVRFEADTSPSFGRNRFSGDDPRVACAAVSVAGVANTPRIVLVILPGVPAPRVPLLLSAGDPIDGRPGCDEIEPPDPRWFPGGGGGGGGGERSLDEAIDGSGIRPC